MNFVICSSLFVIFLLRFLHSERPRFHLSLRVSKVAEFRRDAPGDRRGFTSGLESTEIRTIAPRERPTQPDAGVDRRIVDDVDGPFVVGRALSVAAEVAQISARGEYPGHPRHPPVPSV